MALLSNRRGGLGLLAIGPSGVRRAANERRASYMAAPRAPAINASPGRPIMVDNPINGLFEGMGALGKSLGEYGKWKETQAQKQKVEDAIKAAYAPMTETRTVQRPEGLVYKGRGGAGDVTSGGPIAPPHGAKMDSTSRDAQAREELDRSLALESGGGYGGLTYQPTRTEQAQKQRQRNAFERAQYFASKGLYDLAGKEMEMAKVQSEIAKAKAGAKVKLYGPNGGEQNVEHGGSLYNGLTARGWREDKAKGTGVGFPDGTSENELRAYLLNPDVDPNSPGYLAAWNALRDGGMRFNPVSGQQVQIFNDMRAFRVPGDAPSAPGASVEVKDVVLSKEQQTQQRQLDTVEGILQNYKTLLEETGPVLTPGEQKSALSAAHTELLLELKNLKELGVLAGADLDLLLGMAGDPTSLTENILDYTGRSGLLKQLEILQRTINQKRFVMGLPGGSAPAPSIEASGSALPKITSVED